jgi:hypothetical protein
LAIRELAEDGHRSEAGSRGEARKQAGGRHERIVLDESISINSI